ncbi:hypothetical protein lse_1000 [Listeria seeligeri serovar 1/2b str. SLCC3954]|nr:hypothetical protein lse_1000 [Listeria seeligeri serovar 1/2b str. SLCC3954]
MLYAYRAFPTFIQEISKYGRHSVEVVADKTASFELGF